MIELGIQLVKKKCLAVCCCERSKGSDQTRRLWSIGTFGTQWPALARLVIVSPQPKTKNVRPAMQRSHLTLDLSALLYAHFHTQQQIFRSDSSLRV